MFSNLLSLVASVPLSNLTSSGTLSGLAILGISLGLCVVAVRMLKSFPAQMDEIDPVEDEWQVASFED